MERAVSKINNFSNSINLQQLSFTHVYKHSKIHIHAHTHTLTYACTHGNNNRKAKLKVIRCCIRIVHIILNPTGMQAGRTVMGHCGLPVQQVGGGKVKNAIFKEGVLNLL